MDRRYLLKGLGAITLYSTFPAILGEFITSCTSSNKQLRADFFSNEEFKLIENITDTLLPATATPGALEAHVPYFIELVVKNCLQPADQELIKKGLHQLDIPGGQSFLSLTPEERLEAISKTDVAAFKGDTGKAWFRIVKKLAVIGYFTSQEGMTKALRYVKVPGEYKPCVAYVKGEKALAKTFLMYW